MKQSMYSLNNEIKIFQLEGNTNVYYNMSGVENLSSIACSQDKKERDLNVTYPLWEGGVGEKM